MSIQDLGAIGELIGAVAVIATLIYLASQVRQGSTSLQNSTSWAITQALANINQCISSDREFAELWLRGLVNLEDLDATEFERFRAYSMNLLNLAMYAHKHPTNEHQFYIVHLAEFVRDKPGFKAMVTLAKSSMPPELYEKLTRET